MEPALELVNVSVGVGDLRRLRAGDAVPGQDERQILREVSLRVERGARLALLGESGGGKTTLLRLCNRLAEAGSGEVRVLGQDAASWDVAALRRKALFVPHTPAFFGGTLREELDVARRWRGEGPRDDQALRQALGRVRLEDLSLEMSPEDLSGGQQTRVCLARALSLEPELLLLDEPTGALDVRLARELVGDLVTWAEERGATLVMTTHRPADAAALAAPAQVLLGGQLYGPFPGAELARGEVDAPTVAEFLRGAAS
jgi:UDP-glucose/iron transport system ATP-binding protein